MKPVNVEFIRERAREIRESLVKIRAYAGRADEEFFADERNLYSVMHLLLVSIEAVTGICNHLVAKAASTAPASYAECFEALHELGILDDSLTSSIIRMSRFRNVLVHRYLEIKPELILRYAWENLGDFEAFLEGVGKFAGEQL